MSIATFRRLREREAAKKVASISNVKKTPSKNKKSVHSAMKQQAKKLK
tara:strand:+ start:3352 stop:3495 length:144 start_codon:yes stop_codon:yes gene_type:complete